MIKSIEFKNFRCFENSKLTLRDLSIIVGSNNSGKSTIIEALRIISAVVRKYKNTIYINPPTSFKIAFSQVGFKLPLENLKIDLRTIVHYYRDTVAIITAIFDNKAKIVIRLNTDMVFANIFDSNGQLINTKSKAQAFEIESINIMPQIGLIKDSERLLTKQTVISEMDTYLSSRHFRNELLLFKDDKFNNFKTIAEETWKGLRILELFYNPSENEFIQLLIEDARFPCEIGLMGSGVQMWLQIIWYICRTEDNSTIVLDEPDVYMHPDLQRKILKIIKSKFKQVIIATHSVEIISDVEPYNILTIDKKSRKMNYAGDLKGVQNIIDNIGSDQNLSLVRLGSARKCIFVEGKDIKLLSRFYNILYPDGTISLETLPCISLGGWSRFDEALGAARLFYEETQGQIKTICILDKDYHLDDEIITLKKRAEDSFLDLYIWYKKEIENYLLVPSALFKIAECTPDQYSSFLIEYDNLIDQLKEDVVDQFATNIFNNERRSIELKTANQKARVLVNSKWTTLEEKLKLVNGKDAMARTNEWMKSIYGKSCSESKILKVLKSDEIANELKLIIDILADIPQ
jgi:predicted ATP-dependent endonuclease of OLD family